MGILYSKAQTSCYTEAQLYSLHYYSMDGCCLKHRKWCRSLSFSTEQQKTYRIGEYMERWSIKMKECESKNADFSSCPGCVRNKSDSLHRKHLWTEDWSGWEKKKLHGSYGNSMWTFQRPDTPALSQCPGCWLMGDSFRSVGQWNSILSLFFCFWCVAVCLSVSLAVGRVRGLRPGVRVTRRRRS